MRIVLSFIFCSLFATFSSFAEVERLDPGAFEGFWEIQEPAGDTFVVIVKRGGDISGFWAGSGTTQILKGQWEREGERLVASWESGHRDVLTLNDPRSLRRRGFEPGESLDDSPSVTGRGSKVESGRPGSMAVPRDPEERGSDLGPDEDPHAAPAIPLRNAYTGFWRVRQSTGFLGIGGASDPEFYLQLQRNGRAITALRGRETNNVDGRWRIDDGRVIVEWPNGSRDILADASGDGDFRLRHYRARDVESGRPRSVERAEKVPASEGMRFFQVGEHQMLTVSDIRGIWHIEDPGESGRGYIEIEGWGNAFRYDISRSDRSSEAGNWRLLSDRVVINWASGARDVLRLTEDGFALESYVQGDEDEPVRTTTDISRSTSGGAAASITD